MQLIFMRHAQAGPYVADDAHRTLTELGHRQAIDSAKQLATLYRPELLIVSPYDRARQTAEHVLQTYQAKNHHIDTIICDAITPDGDPDFGLSQIYDLHAKHSTPSCVLVVCHMPIVAAMGAILTGNYYAGEFNLAEFRVYQTEYIAPMLGRQMQSYYPMI